MVTATKVEDKTEATRPSAGPERITMELEDWISVRDNPRQRDTERHAERARHLLIPSPTHHVVSAARLPSGELVKLDGHTRCFLWENARIPQPKTLEVDVYDVPSLVAAGELYVTFDSAGAMETLTDQVYGACRQKGVEFESQLLKNNRFGSACKQLFTLMFGESLSQHPEFTYNAVAYFMPQLREFDKINPKWKGFPTGMMMAVLITMKRYGHSALDFWQRYAEGLGVKIDGEMDAVQALEIAVMRWRAEGRWGRAATRDLLARAVAAFEADRRGDTYTVAVKRLRADTLRSYIRAAASMDNWKSDE